MLTAQGQEIAFRKIHKPFRTIRKEYKLSPVKDYLNEQEGEITLYVTYRASFLYQEHLTSIT